MLWSHAVMLGTLPVVVAAEASVRPFVWLHRLSRVAPRVLVWACVR